MWHPKLDCPHSGAEIAVQWWDTLWRKKTLVFCVYGVCVCVSAEGWSQTGSWMMGKCISLVRRGSRANTFHVSEELILSGLTQKSASLMQLIQQKTQSCHLVLNDGRINLTIKATFVLNCRYTVQLFCSLGRVWEPPKAETSKTSFCYVPFLILSLYLFLNFCNASQP